ncbi:TPA: hypothetical protein ACU21B_000243 [Mannheimia haemolytica]
MGDILEEMFVDIYAQLELEMGGLQQAEKMWIFLKNNEENEAIF